MTVRDLRQRWPRAEALLEVEREIVITRDGKPVAKLVRFQTADRPRRRFDPKRHAKWQETIGRRRVVRWVDEFLGPDRDAG